MKIMQIAQHCFKNEWTLGDFFFTKILKYDLKK